jgi:glycerol-3-phosphate dehydrogenase (NAD(P)+)
MKAVSVLGAGSWGIAVANLLATQGNAVTLWMHAATTPADLAVTREDKSRLPGVKINPAIELTDNLKIAATHSDIIFVAVPAQHVRGLCEQLTETGKTIGILVSLAKGIEVSSLQRVSEVVRDVLGVGVENVIAVSGPSHAEEVARGIPTSVVAAGQSPEAVIEIQRLLSTPMFRVYSSDDLIGVELGGALKNPIALAAGMLYGLKLGDNTLGALLTRGLAEITRLGVRMGARPETFAGLSGLGDLVTTCVSQHSRNRFVGERIGRGEKLVDILASMTMVAEGVETTRAAVRVAEVHRVEMPITQQVHKVLFEDKPPLEALSELMTRELKREVYA